jgi:transcriptional regulator with XRE-family HTH domain
LSKGLHEIASSLGVSHVSVHRWQRGEKKPSADRRRLIQELYRIDPDAWDEPMQTDPSIPPPPSVGANMTHVVTGPIGLAYELERRAYETLRSLDDPSTTPLERARVMGVIAQTLTLVAKMTGQFELGKKLMQLPAWKRIEQEIHTALTPYPEAAAALRDRLLAVQAEIER